MAYEGFPRETLAFLRALRAENTKEWFGAHRAEYERWYVGAAKEFVEAVAGPLRELVPGIQAEPRVLGSIFRINRDTRFAKDAAPYKDHIDFWFWEGERKRAVSGFFVRVSPEFVGIGAGCHRFDPERLAAYRAALATAAAARRLRAHVAAIEGAGYSLGPARWKRLPAGVETWPEMERFARHDALFVHHDEAADERLHSGEVVELCMRHWRALAPLHRWLAAYVQDGRGKL